MTDYTYSKVAVYAELGGALRLARNSRTFVTDTVTGLPVNVTQNGFTAPYLDTDSTGIADFTATTPGPIRLTTGAVFVDVYSEEMPALGLAAVTSSAASAVSASASAVSAAAAASLVGAPVDTAVATIVGNPASATSTSLSSTYARVIPLVGAGIDPTGVGDSTAAVQAKIDAAPAGSNIVVPDGIALTLGNITLTDKVGLTVSGKGQINWTGTAPGSANIGLQLVGTCTDITLRDLRLNGDGVVANRHAGVWCNTGQTLADVKILNNHITNVVLGISVAGCDGLLIEGNHLDTIVGTLAGSGYGIHHEGLTTQSANARIVGNTITRAQRHSIYQARGNGVTISGNTIGWHRVAVADTSRHGALLVGRGSDVTVVGNVIDRFSDGGIEVFADVDTTTRNIVVAHNVLSNQQNGVPGITIGSTSPATEGVPEQVTLEGNTCSLTGAYQHLIIYNGRRIKVLANSFHTLTPPSAVTAIDLYATGETAGTATYSDDISFEHNLIYGADGPDIRGIRLSAEMCLATSRLKFHGNRITSIGAGVDIYASVAVTNPNIMMVDQRHDLTMASPTRLAPSDNGPVKIEGAGSIYSGSGVPTNAYGSNGDLYLRTDGGAGTAIYQRRGGAWAATAA